MQNEHETLGEIIKNARMKADITVEDPVQADSGAVHFTRSDFLPGKAD